MVADIGAGTGVLSIMAANAGAAKVFAIEFAKIVKECKKQVSQRGLGKVIKIMEIEAENAPLDKESVDIIVSEWMGYFLIFERMLPSVLAARDRCLKPGGIMIPQRARLHLAAYTAGSLDDRQRSLIQKDQIAGEVNI